MGPAPLPPHERSWRHPSELVDAPAAAHGASGTSPVTHWIAAVGVGAVAATLVAVLVIAAPRRGDAPVAISATTMPPFSLQQPASAAPATVSIDAGPLALAAGGERVAVASTFAAGLTGAPRSVAAPLLGDAGTGDGTGLVHLVTTSHVYHVALDDLERVIAPDGSLVIDGDGGVLGRFVGGRYVTD